MRRRDFLKISIAVSTLPALRVWPADEAVKKTLWPFYAFDNGVGRGVWTPERQAALLKELGYDGMSYNFTTNKDLEKWLKIYDEAKLGISSLYIPTFPSHEKGKQFSADLRETVKLLKGRSTRLWITFRETKDKLDHDEDCVRIANELGDLAAEQQVKVSIYPHAGFYVEKAMDTLRIAQKAKHVNVSPSYNLCHEFLTKSGPKTQEEALKTLRAVAPSAGLVSINGVSMASKRYIVPLAESDFDLKLFLAELKRLGYQGPVGHQFYSIKGEPEILLKNAMTAWRSLQPIEEGNVNKAGHVSAQQQENDHVYANQSANLYSIHHRGFCRACHTA
jgi:sugar phosphate isomerase/epimerase